MKRLTVVLVLALAVGAVGVGYLIRSNTLTAGQLCQALARMVETSAPTPGTADARYFKTHPEQLARARKRFLEQLPCTLEPLRPPPARP